jgi:hypothetical protein
MTERESVAFTEMLKVRHRHLFVAAQHLANAVVNDDRIVERVAENGEKRGDTREVEVDLGDRHEANREHNIAYVCDHGTERELPFETEPEINQNREDREHKAQCAVGEQFGRRAVQRPQRGGSRLRCRARRAP